MAITESHGPSNTDPPTVNSNLTLVAQQLPAKLKVLVVAKVPTSARSLVILIAKHRSGVRQGEVEAAKDALVINVAVEVLLVSTSMMLHHHKRPTIQVWLRIWAVTLQVVWTRWQEA